MTIAANSATLNQPIRLIVVDDSSATRWLLQRVFDGDPSLEVIGSAADAAEARQLIKRLDPDVITLDVEMPGMNGIDFLRNLMRFHPMPVVMVSTMTRRGAETTLDALALGAVDYIPKPRGALEPGQFAAYSAELIRKVKAASTARVRAIGNAARRPVPIAEHPPTRTRPRRNDRPSRQIIAVGASTGGTEALHGLLAACGEDVPGVLVVQHITDEFNELFVRRLASLLPVPVRNAVHGEVICEGHVYVAPAGTHLAVRSTGGAFECVLSGQDPVCFHRPSVDVLFESMAAVVGPSGIGVILTGMGQDGARGLVAMRAAGAHTIAQDEQSSVVWGMPGSAVRLGGAAEVLPLDSIAPSIRSRTTSS